MPAHRLALLSDAGVLSHEPHARQVREAFQSIGIGGYTQRGAFAFPLFVAAADVDRRVGWFHGYVRGRLRQTSVRPRQIYGRERRLLALVQPVQAGVAAAAATSYPIKVPEVVERRAREDRFTWNVVGSRPLVDVVRVAVGQRQPDIGQGQRLEVICVAPEVPPRARRQRQAPARVERRYQRGRQAQEAAAQAARPLVVDERERRTRRVRLPGLEAAQAIGPRLV